MRRRTLVPVREDIKNLRQRHLLNLLRSIAAAGRQMRVEKTPVYPIAAITFFDGTSPAWVRIVL